MQVISHNIRQVVFQSKKQCRFSAIDCRHTLNRFGCRHPNRKRVTRTRLKRHNFGIFWLVIFARRQPYCIFRTKICSKFYLFQVVEFWESGFLVTQGKNAGNPVGLPSILTQRKRKSASQNRGSDYSLSAKTRQLERLMRQIVEGWAARLKIKNQFIWNKPLIRFIGGFCRSVFDIAAKRTAYVRKTCTDLVRAPGEQLCLNNTGRSAFYNPI